MKNNLIKTIFGLLVLFYCPVNVSAQKDKENLGDKEYIVVKDYKPVLGESFKISDSPEGDTSSTTPPEMDYTIRPKKMNSDYEASTIKAVKIKDEQLAKLYRNYVKLGLGNYTTYSGDLYVNALRSKKGNVGLVLNHFSGDPGLKNVGSAGFSKNHGGLYGKYFFENSTFTGDVNYNRDVVHYYGYNSDTAKLKASEIKQRFNKFGVLLSLGSNYLSQDHLDYSSSFGFSTINDLYDVTEGDLLIAGKIGKKVDEYYVYGDVSFNYFKKSTAKGEVLALNNDLSRSIVTFAPAISFNKEKVALVLGINMGIEKNLGTKFHLFPKIEMSLPIAENVLYGFVGVNGNIVKNTYQTMAAENPFINPAIIPFNTINKLELKAGLKGNFSSLLSFMTQVKYTTVDSMLLYVNNPLAFNKFDALYLNGKVLNMHFEVAYRASEKFSTILKFDQYSYSMDKSEKAWQHPNAEVTLNFNYNLLDKLILNASLYARGKYDVRIQDTLGFISQKVNGYMDLNLGIEYRYSKILSLYVNLNNLGFSRYDRMYYYPSERMNALGGITYSF